MRVRMKTVAVDDEFRKRLALYFGKTGLATRADVRSWREENGTSCDEEMFTETEEVEAGSND